MHDQLSSWASREGAWWSLLARCEEASPFSSPAWLLPWWRHFGRTTLHVIEVRCGTRMMALLPLARSVGDRSTWVLVGTGNSDYLGALVDRDDDRIARPALRAAIEELVARGDTLVLAGLRENDPLRTLPIDGDAGTLEQEDRAPSFALAERWDVMHAALPHGLRTTLGKAARRLERGGALEFESARDETVLPRLEEFFALHDRRWTMRGEEGGVLDDATVRAFHREVALAMSARDMLRLHVVRAGGRAIASFYGYAFGSTVYAYLGGFDPAYARFSPGQLAIAYAMEHAIEHGARRFDFMRGTEAYKYQWGSSDRAVWKRVVRGAHASRSRPR